MDKDCTLQPTKEWTIPYGTRGDPPASACRVDNIIYLEGAKRGGDYIVDRDRAKVKDL